MKGLESLYQDFWKNKYNEKPLMCFKWEDVSCVFKNVTEANIWNLCYSEARVKIGEKESRQEMTMVWSRVMAGEMMETNGFELHVGGGFEHDLEKNWLWGNEAEGSFKGGFHSAGRIGIKQMTIIEGFM